MKDSARYAKIVEWSEEDQCYVGSAPVLIYGGLPRPGRKGGLRSVVPDCRRGDRALQGGRQTPPAGRIRDPLTASQKTSKMPL